MNADSNAIRREIIEAIERLTNQRDKNILRRKYLIGQRFEQIFLELNFEYRWIRRLHKKAVSELVL